MPIPNPIDLEKLLRFFQGMYAHALTLQDLIQTQDDRRYVDVRGNYDSQAEREFALFFLVLNDTEAFAVAVKAFLEAHQEPGKIQ